VSRVPRLDDLVPIVKIHRGPIQVAGIRDRFLDPATQPVELGFLNGDVGVVQRGFDQPVPRIVGVFVRTVVGEVAVIVVGWGNRRTAEGAGDDQVVPGVVDVVIGIVVVAEFIEALRPVKEELHITTPHSGQTPLTLPRRS
jgi:hypothetical protein